MQRLILFVGYGGGSESEWWFLARTNGYNLQCTFSLLAGVYGPEDAVRYNLPEDSIAYQVPAGSTVYRWYCAPERPGQVRSWTEVLTRDGVTYGMRNDSLITVDRYECWSCTPDLIPDEFTFDEPVYRFLRGEL